MKKQKHHDKKILIFISGLLLIVLVLSFRYYYKMQAALKRSFYGLPKIAIVLDDWGYNLNNLELLRSIDIPLTLAVLPNLKYSAKMAEEAKFKNRQIILHMPMEPGRFVRLEKNTITTDMTQEKINAVLSSDLGSMSTLKGVSNHMGSKFTADKKSMAIFLKQIKKKNLYFLDNVSCSNSVCVAVAKNLGVKIAERDVFLDNSNSKDYIRGQFAQVVGIAKKRGYAVATGHDRRRTLEVIKEIAPSLKNKVKFVFVSELAR
ncbi:MAG: divergent polysaccharide deacetylase family protein [Candidatus Omnitrophica bacterium]|nr:divergent polysaccharide deacetylase family protein [Candidatus Omnitrophota bacterium]